MVLQSIVDMSRAMIVGLSELESSASRPDSAEFEKQIAAIRESMRKPMEQQMMLMSLYLYRNAAVDDVNAYAQFYDTELGQAEVELGQNFMSALMTEFGRRFAHEIGRLQ